MEPLPFLLLLTIAYPSHMLSQKHQRNPNKRMQQQKAATRTAKQMIPQQNPRRSATRRRKEV
jgi:hypothetical protein